MDPAIATQLLASIEANRLVILAGAGLSMAAPSKLPSAAALAHECYAAYRLKTGGDLPASAETDLEALFEELQERGELELLFASLVPWTRFRHSPNRGHEAAADFLSSGVVEAILTTNYDVLVEAASSTWGDPDLIPALDGLEANEHREHAPLIKLHGCCYRDRRRTIWAESQLISDHVIGTRVHTLRHWLAGNLMGRDLLVLGFWSDWGYLNSVLAQTLMGLAPARVFVVDLGTTDSLKEKAPELWDILSPAPVLHIQASASNFLDELRARFSRQFVVQLIAQALDDHVADGGRTVDVAGLDLGSDSRALAIFRRWLSGIPPPRPLTDKRPRPNMIAAGIAVLRLLDLGGTFEGPFLRVRGRRVQIVLGNGRAVPRVQAEWQNTPSELGASPDMVICAGAVAAPALPLNIIRSGEGATVVRPQATTPWLTLSEAIDVLPPIAP